MRATPKASWNGMLIDWEGVGLERGFEVRSARRDLQRVQPDQLG